MMLYTQLLVDKYFLQKKYKGWKLKKEITRYKSKLESIIYKAIEDIQAAMSGMLDPEYRDEDTGKAEIREVYKISGVGTVSGCYVTSGKIFRNGKVRIVRDGIIIHEGEILALKRFKDDVKEVNSGYECGMSFVNYNDIKVGDIVEAYITKEVERKL